MRIFPLLVTVTLLSSCAPTTVPVPVEVSSSPVYNRTFDDHPVPVHHHVRKQKIKKTDVQVEKSTPSWSITDDRFITTHSVDLSVEALGRSADEINTRLEELDKQGAR